MAIRARYKGDGNEHINGITRGDIDEELWQGYDAAQRKAVRETKRGDGKYLYDVAADAEMSGNKPAKQKDEAAASTPTAPEGG